MSNKAKLLNVIPETNVNGKGCRYVIFTSGCTHKCEGCHMPDSHDPSIGAEDWQEEVLVDINKRLGYLSGVTLSGGDPFYHAEELAEFCKAIRALPNWERDAHTIWAYTGYTYEQIRDDRKLSPLLQEVDYLVDGRFEQSRQSAALKFRGSANQRILHIERDGIAIITDDTNVLGFI